MTMHLVRGMSSINSKARKQNRKPGWQKAQAEHDKWLMDRGCHSSQIKMKKKEFKEYVPSRPAPSADAKNTYPSITTSDTIPGHHGTAKREPMQYTGTLIVGIGQMHKSNAVPIMRGTNQAKDIARMRR
jgi:hypothetical protein